MKRITIGILVIVVALTFVSVSHAEMVFEIKESMREYCVDTKETRVVLWADYDPKYSPKDDKHIAINCIKCVCPKDGECYPVEAKCPDEKDNK